MGSQPLNGNDARAVLGITWKWIEDAGNGLGTDVGDLAHALETAGYGPVVDAPDPAGAQEVGNRFGACVARYGPVRCLQVKGDQEFHWHSRFYGHIRSDDPLEERESPCG